MWDWYAPLILVWLCKEYILQVHNLYLFWLLPFNVLQAPHGFETMLCKSCSNWIYLICRKLVGVVHNKCVNPMKDLKSVCGPQIHYEDTSRVFPFHLKHLCFNLIRYIGFGIKKKLWKNQSILDWFTNIIDCMLFTIEFILYSKQFCFPSKHTYIASQLIWHLNTKLSPHFSHAPC